jgi:hypothetical protein
MPRSSLVLASLHMARTLCRKVERSRKRRGVGRTLKFCTPNIPSVVGELTLSGKRSARIVSEVDRKFNVDTSGQIHLSNLDIHNPNAPYGNAYQPSLPREFFAMLGSLEIRHGDYTFIDFGSGRRLVLVLPAHYPLRRIIGVEFSPHLHEIAERNIRSYRDGSQRCWNIESVLADVVNYKLPEKPVVLYLFNPLNEKMVEVLLANIRRSLVVRPRPVFVLYKNPIAGSLFEKGKFLKAVRISKPYAIYRNEVPDLQP